MYVHRFAVTNFMIHESSEITPLGFTLLSGGNNGGKSALVDALINLSHISRHSLSRSFEEAGAYSFTSRRNHSCAEADAISYSLDFSPGEDRGQILQYEVSFRPDDTGQLYIEREHLVRPADDSVIFRRGEENAGLGGVAQYVNADTSVLAAARLARSAGQRLDPILYQAAMALNRIHRFRLERHPLESDSEEPTLITDDDETAPPPYLGPRGDGIARLLYYLDQVQRPVLARIEEKLAEVIGGFERFEFITAQYGRVGFAVRFRDSRGLVEAKNLSSGTLCTIGLITLLSRRISKLPVVVCLEEPELGLTPGATLAVYRNIVEATSPESGRLGQLLVTSHSPYLLHEAWNSEARGGVFRVAPENGVAEVRRLDEVVREEALPQTLEQGGGFGVNAAMKILEGPASLSSPAQ